MAQRAAAQRDFGHPQAGPAQSVVFHRPDTGLIVEAGTKGGRKIACSLHWSVYFVNVNYNDSSRLYDSNYATYNDNCSLFFCADRSSDAVGIAVWVPGR